MAKTIFEFLQSTALDDESVLDNDANARVFFGGLQDQFYTIKEARELVNKISVNAYTVNQIAIAETVEVGVQQDLVVGFDKDFHEMVKICFRKGLECSTAFANEIAVDNKLEIFNPVVDAELRALGF